MLFFLKTHGIKSHRFPCFLNSKSHKVHFNLTTRLLQQRNNQVQYLSTKILG